jgi:hypothetical protein
MKLIQIVVDKLPESCGECYFQYDNYCLTKGLSSGQQWVDRCADCRDKNCPLQEQIKE